MESSPADISDVSLEIAVPTSDAIFTATVSAKLLDTTPVAFGVALITAEAVAGSLVDFCALRFEQRRADFSDITVDAVQQSTD